MTELINKVKHFFFGNPEEKAESPDTDDDQLRMVETPNGQKILADKEYTDYLNSTAPQPTQAALSKLLNQVSFIRVLDGGMQNGKPLSDKVLLQVSDAQGIDQLRYCLQIVDGGNGHCMCHGGPTFELINAYNKKLAVISLHHGESIRWNGWKDDAKLVDGRYILVWLAQRGVKAPLEEWQASQQQHDVSRQAWNRWIMAMPECLKEISTQDWEQVFESKDVTVILEALEKAYPDMQQRILKLFDWLGHGSGVWAGYPAYELVAQHLLLQYPVDALTSALEGKELTQEQLEGAARLFSSAAFQKYSEDGTVEPLKSFSYGYTGMAVWPPDRADRPTDIPEPLRNILLNFCLQDTSNEEKQKIALSAYSS